MMKKNCQKLLTDRLTSSLLFLLGVTLLVVGTEQLGVAETAAPILPDDSSIKAAMCALLNFIEGSFGALLMIVAGIGAVMAAAVGSYSAAMSMLVVGCGAFILRSLISVWFVEVNVCSRAVIGQKTAPGVSVPAGGSGGSGGSLGPIQAPLPPGVTPPAVPDNAAKTGGGVTDLITGAAGRAWDNAEVSYGGYTISPSDWFGKAGG